MRSGVITPIIQSAFAMSGEGEHMRSPGPAAATGETCRTCDAALEQSSLFCSRCGAVNNRVVSAFRVRSTWTEAAASIGRRTRMWLTFSALLVIGLALLNVMTIG